MVRPAKEDEVAERRLATIGPVPNVVRVAPAGWTSAAREPASVVADRDSSSQWRRHDLRRPPQIHRLRGAIRDDPAHVRVAREPPSGFRRDRAHVIELRVTYPPLQRCEVDPDHGVRPLARDRRAVARIEPPPADLAERIGAPLARSSQVGSVVRADFGVHDRPKCADQRLPGLRIQVAVDPNHPRERRRHVDVPTLEREILILLGSLKIRGLPPVGEHTSKLGVGQRSAASTSVCSLSANPSGHASRAATNRLTAAQDTSPCANASAVAGIPSTALAIRTCVAAANGATRCRAISHAEIDRKPSEVNAPRRSYSDNLRARSASMMRAARSNPSRSAPSPSSPTNLRSSATSSSSDDRSVLT